MHLGVPFAREAAMSNRYARIQAAGGAAVLVAALGVPAALASGTWTVQPGGAFQATAGSAGFPIADPASPSILCASSTISGTLRSGSGLPGADAGSLSAVSFVDCSAGGTQLAMQAAGLPWHVNLRHYRAEPFGRVGGTISRIRITESDNGCKFLIAGPSADRFGREQFRYNDGGPNSGRFGAGSGTIGHPDTLHFYDVSAGCHGLFHNGDAVAWKSSYAVSPQQAITSP
jgi:hypothetical protein